MDRIPTPGRPSTRDAGRAPNLHRRRSAAIVPVLVAGLLAGCAPSTEDGTTGRAAEMRAPDLMEEARALQERIITLDTHDDIPPDFGSD